MEIELQSRAKIRDIERETAHLRLIAAAGRAGQRRSRAASESKLRSMRAMPLRLLRALPRAS
jgi:hypothetical protein